MSSGADLAGMRPELRPGPSVLAIVPVLTFREAEGPTLVLPAARAQEMELLQDLAGRDA